MAEQASPSSVMLSVPNSKAARLEDGDTFAIVSPMPCPTAKIIVAMKLNKRKDTCTDIASGILSASASKKCHRILAEMDQLADCPYSFPE